MKKYTNKHNIALPMAVWLTRDSYDYVVDPSYISATSILKPLREIALTRRHNPQRVPDVSEMIASRMGTAIHDSYEKAWTDTPKESLLALGYPQAMVDRVLINPEPEDIKEDSICIYLEQRKKKALADFIVGGKFDMVAEGSVYDLKTTSVYTYLHGTNDEKHKLQGSIYRWLNPEMITGDFITIQYLFTDWSGASYSQQKDKGYPPRKLAEKKIPLLTLEETEAYLLDKLSSITKLDHAKEEDFPECTPEELWQGESVFKYYKKPGAAKSTKNFTSLLEANDRLFKDGSVGEVKEVKAMAKACQYCPAVDHCTQKDRLIEEGILVLNN